MTSKKKWWREKEDGWWVIHTICDDGSPMKLYGWPTDELSKEFLKLLNKRK